MASVGRRCLLLTAGPAHDGSLFCSACWRSSQDQHKSERNGEAWHSGRNSISRSVDGDVTRQTNQFTNTWERKQYPDSHEQHWQRYCGECYRKVPASGGWTARDGSMFCNVCWRSWQQWQEQHQTEHYRETWHSGHHGTDVTRHATHSARPGPRRTAMEATLH